MFANLRVLAVFTLLTGITTGCLSPQPPQQPPPDAGYRAPTLTLQDFSGATLSPDALAGSTRMTIALGEAIDPSNQPVALFEGPLDDTLLTDLRQAPLLQRDVAREVPCEIRYQGQRISLTPRLPLPRGTSYTLAVAGYARTLSGQHFREDGEPWTMALHVADTKGAGARVLSSWPAASATSVPANLLFAALAFEGEVNDLSAGVWLEDQDGLAVATAISLVPCEELDPRGDTCVQLALPAPLAPNAVYTLKTGNALRDAHGAPLAGFSARFTTSAVPDHNAPRFLPVTCTDDELGVAVGCAFVDDTSVHLRVAIDEAARVEVRTEAKSSVVLAPTGAADWSVHGLPPGQPLTIEVSVQDAAGNQARAPLALATLAELPALAITEVRANPLGREPAQEFVELTNYGQTPIALRGFTLTDATHPTGTQIASDIALSPGERLLLVADAFDPDDPLDVAPRPGTRLVHVGTALLKSGLPNTGTRLLLRDPQGRRVSAAPAEPVPRPGICNVRVSTDMRSGEAGSFDYDAHGGCTPGE